MKLIIDFDKRAVEIPDSNGLRPLHTGIICSSSEIIESLLEIADPNAVIEKTGHNAAHLLAIRARNDEKSSDALDMVDILVEKKVDFEARDKSGNLPAHLAVSLTETPDLLVKIVTSARLNPNVKDIQGNTILHGECKQGKEKHAEALIQLKADPKIKNADGQVPLHVASNERVIQSI